MLRNASAELLKWKANAGRKPLITQEDFCVQTAVRTSLLNYGVTNNVYETGCKLYSIPLYMAGSWQEEIIFFFFYFTSI
jgi:hypothetical protein